MKNVFTHYTSFGVSISPSCADSQGFLKIREDLMAYVEKNGLSDLTESELWAYDMSKSIAKWRDEYENCVFKSCSFIDESKKSRFSFSLFTRNKKNITHFSECSFDTCSFKRCHITISNLKLSICYFYNPNIDKLYCCEIKKSRVDNTTIDRLDSCEVNNSSAQDSTINVVDNNKTHFNYCGACQSKVEVFKDSSSINTCSQQ
jgi:hypothetical protein